MALAVTFPLLLLTGCVSPPIDTAVPADTAPPTGPDGREPFERGEIPEATEPFDTFPTPVISVETDVIRGGKHHYRLHIITVDPASTVSVVLDGTASGDRFKVDTENDRPPGIDGGGEAGDGASDPVRPSADLILSPTPWRWDPPVEGPGTVRRRRPVGQVVINGREASPPVEPYWGIAFTADGTAGAAPGTAGPTPGTAGAAAGRGAGTAGASRGRIGTIEFYRQSARYGSEGERPLSGERPASDFEDVRTATDRTIVQPDSAPAYRGPSDTVVDTGGATTRVGAFYPLILSGRAVADAYPGRTIRAARVVIAVRRTDSTVAVITVEGDRLFRPGVTTEELAGYLRQRGFDSAINLDGGRSAFVQLPDGTVLPRRIPFRRIGPVQLVCSVVP